MDNKTLAARFICVFAILIYSILHLLVLVINTLLL